MDPGISFGNLGISEWALVLAVTLVLFGAPGGPTLRTRTEWRDEMRRRRYFLGSAAAGVVAGIVAVEWTEPERMAVYAIVSTAVGALLMALVATIRSESGVRRAGALWAAAVFVLSWGVATDLLAILWVAA